MAELRHSLDQLRVLDAIARTGSFSGAAAELHRVPSAISYAVRTLEEQLEVALFERLGNRTRLTPAGEALLQRARAVLAHAEALDAAARELRDGWEPLLHVVVDGLFPWEPVARALSAFTDGDIPTRVRVDVEYQEGVPERWQADDAALMVILDFDPEDDPLTCHPLDPLEMVLVASPGHPLARRRGLSRDDLHDAFELVVKDSSPRYSRDPKQAFMGSRHVVYLSDFHAKRLTARAGVGFGWLPLHLVRADLDDGTLVLLDVPDGNRWTYHPQLVHRSDRPLGRAARRFVDALLAGQHQSS
ncbi:MAG: LysR family transcriptional regulator [Alphaproteobacteria bacterium]|nr:LysR family transcriptional regulator [Alphaproteobacteria bacterium]